MPEDKDPPIVIGDGSTKIWSVFHKLTDWGWKEGEHVLASPQEIGPLLMVETGEPNWSNPENPLPVVEFSKPIVGPCHLRVILSNGDRIEVSSDPPSRSAIRVYMDNARKYQIDNAGKLLSREDQLTVERIELSTAGGWLNLTPTWGKKKAVAVYFRRLVFRSPQAA